MSGPANASINGDGFRAYQWEPDVTDPANLLLLAKYGAMEPTTVLSVTSIRSLCGTPFQLVAWQIGNVVNVATGQRKAEWRDYSKSKRGRLVKGYRKDGPFPGEFVTRMIETRGNEDKVSENRAWLKAAAEEPRDVAAVRGSVVHKLIELNVALRRLDEEGIRQRFDEQWADEKRKVKLDVTDADVAFVLDAMARYWEMREKVPFVILTQEPQVWNLSAGYAGSVDVLLWFLGTWDIDGEFVPLDLPKDRGQAYWQKQADKHMVSITTVAEVGGQLALGDWKTSPDVYTGHVVQGTAYLGAGFVGRDGKINERLTELLVATMHGMIVKIRPDQWEVDFFRFDESTMMAFLGSCAFARFLAFNKTPNALFTHTIRSGDATTETDEVQPDAAA